MAPGFPAPPADHRHVFAIATHGLTTLPPGVARFIGVEFVRGALRMRRLPTLARDLALLAAIHRREAPIAPSTNAATALHVVARVVALSLAVDRFIRAIVVAWSVQQPAPPKSHNTVSTTDDSQHIACSKHRHST
jgi:hypothetical protein